MIGSVLAAAAAGCSHSTGASLDDAKAALEAGDYQTAKNLAFQSKSPERFDFLNRADAQEKASDQVLGELKAALSHAEIEGKEKTKSVLDRLLASAPDARAKREVTAAIDGLDAMFAKFATKKPESIPSVPRPQRVEGIPIKKTRYVDEKAPEDGAKKRQSWNATPRVRELLDSAMGEARNGRYRQSLELMSMISGELTSEDRAAMSDAADEVRGRAKEELTNLVATAKSQLRLNSTTDEAERTLEKLYSRLREFPNTPDVDSLRSRVDGLLMSNFSREEALALLDTKDQPARTVSEERPGPAGPPKPRTERLAPPRDSAVEELSFKAEVAYKDGDLDAAKLGFLDAAAKATIPALKSELAGRAEECSRMLTFLQRLGVAIGQDAAAFQELDLGEKKKGNLVSADGSGATFASGDTQQKIAWDAAPAPALIAIVKKLGPIPPEEKLGAAIFLMKAKATREADLALKEVIDANPQLRGSVDSVIARSRNIEVPAYGFVWFKNSWVTFKEREGEKLAERVKELLAKVDSTSITPKERAAASDELRKLGLEATESLIFALRERKTETMSKLRSASFIKKLGPIRAEREALDRARKFAFELIFDEVKYFYPYNPPECPPEKAKLYPEVQQEVDHRVDAVKDLWNSKVAVALGSAEKLLRLLRETDAQLRQLGALDLTPDPETELCLAVDPLASELTIRNFCWTPKERVNLLEFNRRMGEFNATAQNSQTAEDRRLTTITNQYREMMGRKMLAANEKLLQSARKHAQWMANTGTFSHFSTLPNLRSPFDRMKAEGYLAGIGENIALSPGPDAAFYGWAHSSGHHRNMLAETHSEFGCAGISRYWVQNFGAGDEFRTNAAWPRN